MRQIYHADMYRFEQLPHTFWQSCGSSLPVPVLDRDLSVEIAVIGGGYTGLSAALHLSRDHGIAVAVLDAAEIGWGASGRNGGFNGVGATKLSLQQLIDRYGLQGARDFCAAQADGQALVLEIAEREAIDIERAGDGIFAVAHSNRAFLALAEDRDALSQLGVPCELIAPERAAAEIFSGPAQFGALRIEPGCGIHPLRYVQGLGAAALRHGAMVFSRSAVTSLERDGSSHLLHTAGGTVRARQVIVALNGYLPDGLHETLDARILPAISNILTTRKLTDAEATAHGFHTRSPIYDTRHLLHYFRRLPDGRMLFGARGDLSGDRLGAERQQVILRRHFDRMFPAWTAVETEYFWRGFVALTRPLVPVVGRLPDEPSIWYGFGCHGSGVSTQTWMGRTIARAIAGTAPLDQTLPAPMRGLPGRLPGPPLLRRAGLGLAYLGAAVSDALH